MRIKPSLKIYFTLAMLLLGFVMTLSFSALTLNYFTQGLDRGIQQSLMEAAEIQGSQKGKPVLLLGFHIASSWEDVPNRIKEIFDNTPPVENDTLQKRALSANLFTPPEEIYLVLKAVNKAGQLRYISKIINKADVQPGTHHGIPHIAWIGVFAITAIGLFLLVVLFIISKVAKPVESLKDWAKSLDEEKLTQPIPDFQYSELNTLAEIVKMSLSSVQESLLREQQFLSYASHELRTPLAVMRTNTELLTKLNAKQGCTAKQSDVLARIDRAGNTMINLTNTLLWLSRNNANQPESEKFYIDQLIVTLTDELNYLLNNKPVQLTVNISPQIVNTAEIPCRIVLANLIRNAFQHTSEGSVVISQVGASVSIVNTCEDKSLDRADLGFGLGLRLTKKLAANYNWSYCDKIEGASYQVQIHF